MNTDTERLAWLEKHLADVETRYEDAGCALTLWYGEPMNPKSREFSGPNFKAALDEAMAYTNRAKA